METGHNKVLLDLVTTKMPFGKYKGIVIADVPENYLIWLRKQGFPHGKLGVLLSTAYEIRLNGLEAMFTKLKKIASARLDVN